MQDALVFILKSLVGLYLLVLLLRFWLPFVRADFRNPVSQGILKVTSPLIAPLRRLIPSFGRLDTATVLVTFAIQYLLVLLILTIGNQTATVAEIALMSVFELILLNLKLFMIAIFIYVIMSWIAPATYNPATAIVSSLVRPILEPFSRILPKPGGIDISPIIVIILFQATIMIVEDIRVDVLFR